MKKIGILLVIVLGVIIFSGCEKGAKKNPIGKGGVYHSSDGGKTFELKSHISEEENLSTMSVLNLTISPSNPDVIYALTWKKGIYRSSNGGKTWAKSKNNFSYVGKIALDPTNEDIIYIVADSGGERALFKTTDGGNTWTRLLSQRNQQNPIILDVLVDQRNPDIVYTTDSTGGVYKSMDGGKEWAAIFWATKPIRGIMMDSFDSQRIYLWTTNSGIYMSRDGGKTFENSGMGKRSSANTNRDTDRYSSKSIQERALERKRMAVSNKRNYNMGNIYSMAISKVEKNVFYVLSQRGLQVSRDGGDTYENIEILLPPNQTFANLIVTDPVDKDILYLVSGRIIYKTTNGGKTWTSMPLEIKWPVETFVVSRNNQNSIFMGLAEPLKPKNSFFPFFD